LPVHIKDRRVMNPVGQYLRRSACTGFAHKAENALIYHEALCPIAEQHLRKGARVYLEGQIQTRKWTAAQGYRGRATLRAGRCLKAFNRRKPLTASIMPAAVQRNAIAAFRHHFTLRQTRRTVPIMFSIELVQASERLSFTGKQRRFTVSISRH
jgi:hypothetical protein